MSALTPHPPAAAFTGLPTMAPWVGKKAAGRGILILGESWYGEPVDLAPYIKAWAAGTQRDYLFSRMFNAASGYSAATASADQREAFWDTVSFDNFVNWSVGPDNTHKAGARHFRHAATTLPDCLAALALKNVWILGRQQQHFSGEVVRHSHPQYLASPHPCGRVSTGWENEGGSTSGPDADCAYSRPRPSTHPRR